MTTERMGDWMQTYPAGKLWPLDPHPEDYNLEMGATALSKQCRFAGHCNGFYSVAEHSVLVSYVVQPHLALQGLMHDFTEAGCVDVPKPFKVGLPDYNHYEAKHWRAVAARFGLPEDLDPRVHAADVQLLLAEKQKIMDQGVAWNTKWAEGLEPAKVRIHRHHWKLARLRFLWRYRELTEGPGWYSLPLKFWLL